MATFPDVCLWDLSYVNVPTVNLKAHSMNIAIRTLFRPIMFRTNYTALLVRTTCTGVWI